MSTTPIRPDACFGVGCPHHADCELYSAAGQGIGEVRVATCCDGHGFPGYRGPTHRSVSPPVVSSAGVTASPAFVPVVGQTDDGDFLSAHRNWQPQGEIGETGVMRL